MNNVEDEIRRLEALGHERSDIHVLPNGSVCVIHQDEHRTTASAIHKATARDRLRKLLVRKQELDNAINSRTLTGLQPDPMLEAECLAVTAAIATLREEGAE